MPTPDYHPVVTEPIRVLHVDDDPEFGSLTQTCLPRESDRFTVETVTSADAALDRLSEDIDCVVSDYDMPGTDGLEFLEAVREDYPDLPFILFTGKGSEEVASDAISAGVTDYLQKQAGTDQFELLSNRLLNAVDRYTAEREVKAANRRFERLLQESADYIQLLDADGTIEYLTPSVEHVLGYDPESKVGENSLSLVHPEDRERAAEQFQSIVDDPEDVSTVELRVRHRDGSWRWLSVRSRNMLDDEAIGAIVGNVRDITDRKAQQAEVDWHRTVIEAMDDGVYVVDAEKKFQFVDYRAEAFDTVTEAELIGQPVSALESVDIISEGELAWIEDAIDRILAGEVDEVSLEIDADTMPEVGAVELRLTRIEPAGYDPMVLTTSRDITERTEREAELRTARSQYQALVHHFPHGGVFLFDHNMEYMLAGGAGLEAVGLTSEDFTGKTPWDVFPESIADELTDYYSLALAGEESTFEQEYDGSTYRIQTVPVEDEGEVVCGLAVSQNITDQKARERRLQHQNERLEAFASVVSHDLRNPLTVALSRIELAQQDSDQNHLDHAATALKRMDELIEDLLTLAREGEAVSDREAVDLPDLVSESWQHIQTDAGVLDVGSIRPISADRSRLQQLVENLLRNAVEHGSTSSQDTTRPEDGVEHGSGNPDADAVEPRDGASAPGDRRSSGASVEATADGAVTIEVGEMDDGTGFYVADDGPGIPEEDRERVFEGGYSTVANGTGFGLAIVSEIAEAHGWSVSVTDSERGGARFEVTGVEFLDD